ncbi:sigma 54-interacting transcriptional regulator [Hyalangium rubrum]|uniref:Sigma 54-interacting transcriptional regulator n=1 Tax=Hyalangium rubrum TaxID=3103134 RepID=A0ABU5HB02_9BACT|nr:sigma 54-interacting transcriptional regulator [Hyalangium sp. s54d21]MDY7230645.1 sigma 54-interacting transcriptional regulator [Hyalangium sp. s54d21]
MPALLLLSGPSSGRRFEVVSEVTLGRSPSCEIQLDDDKVSRRHARVFLRQGQAWLSDLGSRNGTLVNGERVEGEALLLPGDRVQVGETIAVYEPPIQATMAETEPLDASHIPIAEVLPHVGPEAGLFSAGVALLGATSEAMVLRRLVDEAVHALNADRAAALLGGHDGLLTAAVSGASSVEVPRFMASLAMDLKEVASSATALCTPLVASGGMPFGLLYVERAQPFFSALDARLVAALGRMGGEAYTAMRSRVEVEQAPAPVTLVGSSRPLRRMIEQARRAAASTVPVVIYGEPGAGKSLLAHYIHSRSPRALGPLVAVDCRQPPAVVEELLFGRASAPGEPPRSSALLRADGGTLLLQHVEALSRTVVERLTRLLARKVASARHGGEEPVDLRLIATSGTAVQLLAAKGEVDPALATALSGLEIEVPPLRERRADVLGLFEHFAMRGARLSRSAPPGLSSGARRLLVDYDWPHNVRELKLVSERLALVYAGKEVHALRLPPEIQEGSAASEPRSLQHLVERLERDAITEALQATGGKKIRAAERLGISRPTLDKKIDEYAITVEKSRRG